MTVLIHGAEARTPFTGNRGAELMLREVARRVESAGLKAAVPIRHVHRDLRKSLALAQYVGGPRWHAMSDLPVPALLKSAASIKTNAAITAVFDASGFVFGDPWGVTRAENVARKLNYWADRGMPVILLPQAFGPFNDPRVRAAAIDALEAVRLLWVRDERSAEALSSLGLTGPKIRQAPDIIFADPSRRPRGPTLNRLAIVPNWNIQERVATGGRGYLDALAAATDWARAQGLEPVGLLHEGARDLTLLDELRARTGLTVLDRLDALQAKQEIGRSRVVLTGRYHAAVSALSAGVPTVVHGWSHKYRQLLDDVRQPGWLAQPLSAADTTARLQSAITDEGAIAGLRERAEQLARAVELMWEETFAAAPQCGVANLNGG